MNFECEARLAHSTWDQRGAGRRAPFSDDREGYHSNAGGSVLDDSVGYARSHAGVTDEEPCSTERYTSALAFQRLAAVLAPIRTRAHLSGPNARYESIAESPVDAGYDSAAPVALDAEFRALGSRGMRDMWRTNVPFAANS